MSCSKQCFEVGDKFEAHHDCKTCPGQDSGPTKDGKKYCAACNDWHFYEVWPHDPKKEGE